MTEALPGGAAAKAAIRYEHLWTVLRIAKMLEGKISRIRLEPPGVAGTGVELELDAGGITWGEQVKDGLDTWTISRLRRKGILLAVRTQIDQGRRFRFVSSSNASDFRILTHRARQAETLKEFVDIIGTGRLPFLEAIAGEWDTTRDEAWRLLRKVKVEHLPTDALYRIVKAEMRHLYVEDADAIIGELRNFCDQQSAESFTAVRVSVHLEEKGFTRRLIRGDRDILRQLHRTVRSQERRIEGSKPPIGIVPSPDLETILERLRRADCPQLFVLDGRAGSGKSTVATHVATTLQREGWFVTVVRMDGEASMRTSDHLGREMGLTETPSVLLAGVSDGSPALLVVDQLDAVSTYSGRMPNNFEAVAEVIDEIKSSPNIKIMLVVRTVDLNEDPRLRSIISKHSAEQRTVGELDVGNVQRQLSSCEMRIPTSGVTLELLRVPLHLSVFSRLSPSAQAHPFKSLQELYERYVEETRGRIEQQLGQLHWMQITGRMVTYMNEKEVLKVPTAVLDGQQIQEVHALVSESVLVRTDDSIAFFHESFFDYVFARAFVAQGRSLEEFLQESSQHLFRRAQTRQVLEHLAATDRPLFRATVMDLLTSDEIRSHLKAVVIMVLRQIEPTSRDWLAVEDLAWSGLPLSLRLLRLLNLPDWFDVADGLGRWEAWLSDPDRVGAVFGDLVSIAKERPLRVVDLLRPYVGLSEEWRVRIRNLIVWSLNKDLAPFATELVKKGQLDDARGPVAVNSDFWSLFHSLKDEDPKGAARLMGAHLRRGFELAVEAGSGNPFSSRHLSRDSQSHSVIADVAAQAPLEFIQEVLPFVLDVAMANQRQYEGSLPRGECWGLNVQFSEYTVDGLIFTATDAALRMVAQVSPVEWERALERLRSADSYELRLLACRAMASKGDADEGIAWITADSRHLEFGWSGSPLWASRELIESLSPSCDSALFSKLESLIIGFSPPWEGSEYRDYGKYVLLTALDSDRMSGVANAVLRDLEIRFTESPPEPPRPMQVSIVESPISYDASATMSDDDWIQALCEHDRDGIDSSGLTLVGGARELAGVLGQRTKEDPERFSRLGLRFTDAIPASAMEGVLRNVDESVDIQTLAELCQHAEATYGFPVGRSVCDAIDRAKQVNVNLVDLIIRYSQAPEEQNSVLTNGMPWEQKELLGPGMNTTPGKAVLTAASILFRSCDYVDAFLPMIKRMAVSESLPLRACVAEALIALLRHAPSDALRIAIRLFDSSVEVLNAPTSERLLIYGIMREPEIFAHVLQESLGARREVAVRAGRVWALACLNSKMPTTVTGDFNVLPTAARIGAAEVLAHNMPSSQDLLTLVLNDPDPEVRQQSGHAIGSLDQLTSAELESFLRELINSRAFSKQMDNVAFRLKELTSRLPTTTMDFCERAVEVGGAHVGDMSTRHGALGSFLMTLLLRLYRQSDAPLRSRCLDVIDRLTELNAYGVEDALERER